MKICIINGPNLNLLGRRETSIYGKQSFEIYLEELEKAFPEIEIDYFQSNLEGALIDKMQEVGFGGYQGIILNGAGFTHTSVALADTIAAIETPVVEVHISNIYAREEFRQKSLTAKNCLGCITGFGLEGYRMALQFFERRKPKKVGFTQQR